MAWCVRGFDAGIVWMGPTPRVQLMMGQEWVSPDLGGEMDGG